MRLPYSLLASALALTMHASDAAAELQFWIDQQRDPASHALFRGIVAGDSAERVRYELRLNQAGAGGRTSVQQSGALEVTPGKESVTSTIRARIRPDDHYRVILRLYKDGSLLGERTLDSAGQGPEGSDAR